MKTWLISVVGSLILAAGITAIVWHVRRAPNLALEEPPFNAIALPLKSIRGGVILDGGSVCVRIEDRIGCMYYFVFPYDHKTKGYPVAFHGDIEPYAPRSVALSNPSRARNIVLNWMRDYGANDEGLELAYDYLSGRNNSIIRRVQRDGIGGIYK